MGTDVIVKWTLTSFGVVLLWFLLLWLGARIGNYKTRKKNEQEKKWLEEYYEKYPWKREDREILERAVKRDIEETLKGLERMRREKENE